MEFAHRKLILAKVNVKVMISVSTAIKLFLRTNGSALFRKVARYFLAQGVSCHISF